MARNMSIDGLTAGPGSSIPISIDLLSTGLNIDESAEYFANFRFILKKDAGLLKAGFEAAYEQVLLQKGQALSQPPALTSPLQVNESNGGWLVSVGDTELFMDREKGTFTRLSKGGNMIVEEGPRPDFWRIPVDNDYGPGYHRNMAVWKDAGKNAYITDMKKASVSTEAVVFEVSKRIDEVDASFHATYTIQNNGLIGADYHFEPDLNRRSENLFRLGT